MYELTRIKSRLYIQSAKLTRTQNLTDTFAEIPDILISELGLRDADRRQQNMISFYEVLPGCFPTCLKGNGGEVKQIFIPNFTSDVNSKVFDKLSVENSTPFPDFKSVSF